MSLFAVSLARTSHLSKRTSQTMPLGLCMSCNLQAQKVLLLIFGLSKEYHWGLFVCLSKMALHTHCFIFLSLKSIHTNSSAGLLFFFSATKCFADRSLADFTHLKEMECESEYCTVGRDRPINLKTQ